MSFASKAASLVLLSTLTLFALLLFVAQHALPLPSNSATYRPPAFSSTFPAVDDDDDHALSPHFTDNEDDEDEEEEDLIHQITRRLDALKATRELAADEDVSDLEL
jgi:hypothetical protein